MNTLQKFEAKQLAKLQSEKQVPQFSPGDTIKVNVKVKEGTRERIQAYEGVCIARTGEGMNENFCVRKISYGEGVERTFPLWSSRIESIELIRRGSVRRAKLYYLRDLRGKSARISERTDGHGFEAEAEAKAVAQEMTQTQRRANKKAEKEAARAEARAGHEAKAKAKADAKAAEAKAAAAETPAE